MKISVSNGVHQDVIDRVYAAKQGHVFRFWNELSDNQKENLLAQLAEIDFALLADLHSKFILSAGNSEPDEKLEPAEFIGLPKSEAERAGFAKARATGEKAISAGKVAAFLVAGGQGTRLGFPGPKGKFPVSPVKNKTLFQLHAEKILATSRRFNTTIPWYIMTSETNHDETCAFFEENNFWGLNPGDIVLFKQDMIPALDRNGCLLLDRKDHVFSNPNGHGGSLSALKASGALDDMKQRGIEYLFYFQVDNVLVKICDPVFVGFHIIEEAEMSAKIVAKVEPGERVGVCGLINGTLGVIEYSDLSEAEKNARNDDGSLKFQAGNIAIHMFDVSFIERETAGGLQLPWHLAHKKIPYLDDSDNFVQPAQPNAYKFETFVFDALADAHKAGILEVAREDEFSPVKNVEGEDSAETARRHMINESLRWLASAGVKSAKNGEKRAIEISPLFALDADEFKEKLNADPAVGNQTYFG